MKPRIRRVWLLAAIVICSLLTLHVVRVQAGEETGVIEEGGNAISADREVRGSNQEQGNRETPIDRYGDVTAEGRAVPNQEQASSQEYGDINPKEYGGTEAKEEGQEGASLIADPLEQMNRAFFVFNDKLYFWLIKPVSKAYRRVIPEDFRNLFGNFYRNLGAPIRVANNLLQLKARQTGTEVFRFLVNSTIGVGGLRDVAKEAFGVEAAPEDLGQTFGFYGLGTGFYLVLPLLGPSSFRDGLGLAGDLYLSPISYVDPRLLRYGLRAHDRVNDVSFSLGDYEAFKKAALDPYVAMREAYAANREAEIKK